MKTITRAVPLLIPTLVVFSFVRAQEKSVPDRAQSLKADVAAASSVKLAAVVKKFSGKLERENISRQITEVLDEVVRQRIDNGWENYSPKPILILYEDPSKADFRASVGVSVPAGTKAKEPLKVEEVEFKSAVRHVHKGPHEQLARVYRQISEVSGSSGRAKAGWPVVLQILDDPNRVNPDQVRTLLNVPLE